MRSPGDREVGIAQKRTAGQQDQQTLGRGQWAAFDVRLRPRLLRLMACICVRLHSGNRIGGRGGRRVLDRPFGRRELGRPDAGGGAGPSPSTVTVFGSLRRRVVRGRRDGLALPLAAAYRTDHRQPHDTRRPSSRVTPLAPTTAVSDDRAEAARRESFHTAMGSRQDGSDRYCRRRSYAAVPGVKHFRVPDRRPRRRTRSPTHRLARLCRRRLHVRRARSRRRPAPRRLLLRRRRKSKRSGNDRDPPCR